MDRGDDDPRGCTLLLDFPEPSLAFVKKLKALAGRRLGRWEKRKHTREARYGEESINGTTRPQQSYVTEPPAFALHSVPSRYPQPVHLRRNSYSAYKLIKLFRILISHPSYLSYSNAVQNKANRFHAWLGLVTNLIAAQGRLL